MKITSKSNFRVELTPRRLGDYGSVRTSDSFAMSGTPEEIQKRIEERYQERCEEIIEQIRRHVDNVDSFDIQFDVEETCEFCGSRWEVCEDDDDPVECPRGMPLCCTKAIEEFKENQKNA